MDFRHLDSILHAKCFCVYCLTEVWRLISSPTRISVTHAYTCIQSCSTVSVLSSCVHDDAESRGYNAEKRRKPIDSHGTRNEDSGKQRRYHDQA